MSFAVHSLLMLGFFALSGQMRGKVLTLLAIARVFLKAPQ